MKNHLLVLKLISIFCIIGIESQETCESYSGNVTDINDVIPRFVGEIGNLSITNAVSLSTSGEIYEYFSVELSAELDKIIVKTTEKFVDYEKYNYLTRHTLTPNIRCTSSTSIPSIRVTIAAVNNYAPEFTASNYEIKIPTPVSKGFEITSILGSSDKITAIDYDLYNNSIKFSITGSDLFDVVAIAIAGTKTSYMARIVTKQQIIKLENNEIEFNLTATDSFNDPKSTSVSVKILIDPEILYIDSPNFLQPLYRGELESDGTIKIAKISLDESTYDENVNFDVLNDEYDIINISNDGPNVQLDIKEKNLNEEIFKQNFINFVIEAKRQADRSGFAAVVLEVTNNSNIYFQKSFYEGELKERHFILTTEEIKLVSNNELKDIVLNLSQSNVEYFDVKLVDYNVILTLKQDAKTDEILNMNLLFLKIEAFKENILLTSTSVLIKTIKIPIPQLDKNIYMANIKDGELNHDTITIIEGSFNPDDELEVEINGDGAALFNFEILQQENMIKLNLKPNTTVPSDITILNFELQVGIINSSRKNSAVVICALNGSSDSQNKLIFNSPLYEGKLSQNLSLTVPEISLNIFDGVQLQLFGKHGNYFNISFDENRLILILKNGVTLEQFSTDIYLQISIEASHETHQPATSNLIIGIERSSVKNSAFEKSLYVGNIDDQSNLILESLIIKSEDKFDNIWFSGEDSDYFGETTNENVVTIQLLKAVTDDLLLQKTILNAKVNAEFEDILLTTNLIVTLPRPDEIKKLRFERLFSSGIIRNDTELTLVISDVLLIPTNYDETVEFTLSGSDASFFTFIKIDNKIILQLKADIEEEQILTRKFMSFSVIATREGFESAEHFAFINVEVFNPSESLFEKTLYIGNIDDHRALSFDTISIKSEYDFRNAKLVDDDFEYFEAAIDQNRVTITLIKEITENLLIQKSILSSTLIAEYDDVSISTKLVVTLPRPDEIKKLKFEAPFSNGKIDIDLNLHINEISLHPDNYDDNVIFRLSGTDTEFFILRNNSNKIDLLLKPEITEESFRGKNFLNLILIATKDDFDSAEHYVFIYIEKTLLEVDESSFEKGLYIGNIDKQSTLHVETLLINSEQQFSEIQVTGEDSEYFSPNISQNIVSINLQKPISEELLLQKSFLAVKVSARYENVSIYTSLVVILPKIDEMEKLEFETSYSVGKVIKKPQLRLGVPEISLKLENYDQNVEFEIHGASADYFEFLINKNKIQIRFKSEVNEESVIIAEYFMLILQAARNGFASAQHFVFAYVEEDKIDDSKFEKGLYFGTVDNQKQLRIDPIPINSENEFWNVALIDGDSEYFNPSLSQNYVTIALIKEITEDLLMQKSFLSSKVVAQFDDISISTNIVVSLPKINADKILRFEKSHYIGSISELILSLDDVVLELNNYDETVAFTLDGSDKDLFVFDEDQNTLKFKLSSETNEESLRNRVFLTFTIFASRNDFLTAQTAIFVHLNVVVNEILPIEFENPVYKGTLTFENVLLIEKISIISDENEVQISHKGEHAKLFRMDNTNMTDIRLDFIQQPINADQKFLYFYIEALKFGAPKAYATVVIEVVEKIQLKFERINYFGSFDEEENLTIDPIPLNSDLSKSDVSFRLVNGHNEFFSFNYNSSFLEITKKTSIIVTNINFLWFYLEAYGCSYQSTRTLIVIGFPQNLDIPIDECYDKLDPTQPYFETGSYSFTMMSDETGSIGKIKAIILDPDDSIATYVLSHDNFLNDKLSIFGGDIRLNTQIPTGIYRMIGVAISTKSEKVAKTNIELRVLEAKVCENGVKVTTVQKILAIETIHENTIDDHIMNTKINDCEYEILEVIPDVFRDYLIIDTANHYLKNIEPFDRESRLFENYRVPQLQVKMKLNCPEAIIKSTNSFIQSFSNNVFTDEILYSPSITYLNLEILDQNDNPPIFTNPPRVNYLIGFPDEELIGLTMIKCLYKVEAYDLDEGENALIRYSTSMPTVFEIDSITGEIYSLRPLPDNLQLLVITAIDRNGIGLRTTTSMQIVKLSITDIVEITADKFSIWDIDELAEILGNRMNVDFRILSSTQLPLATNSQMRRSTETEARIKIYAYAFKINSNDLMNSEELISRLEQEELDLSIHFSKIDVCSNIGDNQDDCDLKMWIFAVSFMGTFILLILIAIPIIWFRFVKNKLQATDNSSESSKEEIAEHFYETHIDDRRRSNPIPADIVQLSHEVRPTDAEIIGVNIQGVTKDESTSDAERLSNKLLTLLEDDSPTNDKKVSFNELVERIEVLDDSDGESIKNVKY